MTKHHRLLPLNYFDDIFLPLVGKKVYIHDNLGNIGDAFISFATRHLLNEYRIDWNEIGMEESDDVVLLGGGGNMGDDTIHVECREMRQRQASEAKAVGKETIVLPQSACSFEHGQYDKVFARDKSTLKIQEGSILAPDLTLGYAFPDFVFDKLLEKPLWKRGLFLREDMEKAEESYFSIGDPSVGSIEGVQEFLYLASQFAHIITNRLHFAIAGMTMMRRVTLLPNSYHKNRSVWEAWLKDLGCEWCDSLKEIS